jgi:chromosome segregation ATPase
MSPAITPLVPYLCGAFVFGILVGWLAKQLRVSPATEPERETWEERLRRHTQELEAARSVAQSHAAQMRGLQDQLTTADGAMKKLESSLATTQQELETKAAELTLLQARLSEAQAASAQSKLVLSEERQLARRLGEEIKILRRDLADKAETLTQLSQRLKAQDLHNTKTREQEANHQLLRSRLEFTLRTKDTEIQQLQSRLATFEIQQNHLTESNRNLRHSCARYQSDLHETRAEIERLRTEITALSTRDTASVSPMMQLPPPDLRAYMNVQEKDVEIARLRARISELQMLLRRGAGRLRLFSNKSPVDVAQIDTPQE